MLTKEEEKQAHALYRLGYPLAAIARHLGRDRATIRSYIHGGRAAGVRRSGPSPFAPFVDYCSARLADNPHASAREMFEQVRAMGYPGGYSSFTQAIRTLRLRPPCPGCGLATERGHAGPDGARTPASSPGRGT